MRFSALYMKYLKNLQNKFLFVLSCINPIAWIFYCYTNFKILVFMHFLVESENYQVLFSLEKTTAKKLLTCVVIYILCNIHSHHLNIKFLLSIPSYIETSFCRIPVKFFELRIIRIKSIPNNNNVPIELIEEEVYKFVSSKVENFNHEMKYKINFYFCN